jgi:transcriptional repressor NrdR
VRFASVYRRFEDVSDFEDVIEEFRRPKQDKPTRKR